MKNFISSLKADLTDRRMLPLFVLVGVALLAAVGYAVLGGGSSSTAPTAATSAPSIPAGTAGIAVIQAPALSNQAVAETTSGSAEQRHGASRDPFIPLAGTGSNSASSASAAATSASAAGSKSAGSSSGSSSTSTSTSASGSGSSSKTSTETAPATTPKPAAPAKPETVYHVAVLFGVVPAGTAPESAKLTPYENLKRQAPLPSSTQPIVVFRGVTAAGKSATFTLVGEAILRGAAKCLPSASQCQAIELKPGQIEEFEYLPPTGAAVTYALQLVDISSSKATASAARSVFRGESKAGRELLRRIGLIALPGLRYSEARGVLLPAHQGAFGARAHLALRSRSRL